MYEDVRVLNYWCMDFCLLGVQVFERCTDVYFGM